MLVIPEIRQLTSENLAEAGKLLKQTELHPIGCVNWPDSYPERPQVGFRMAHNGMEELFIHFTVNEESTLALVTEDNGEVWTDSCVEFFLALDDSGYYNFEFSCIGKALLGFRKDRLQAKHATAAIMASIKRLSTLGTANFKEKKLGENWELTVVIPASALFRHNIKTWKGQTAKINLYKCGDHLTKPHYLSWQPINTPEPNFHVPACFTAVKF